MLRTLLTVTAALAVTTLTLTACGSGDDNSITGAKGSMTFEAPEGDGEPKIDIADKPFSVDETVIKTVNEGDGEVVPDMAEVKVDYYGVNGRTGEKFDASYGRAPVTFPLSGVVAGFSKAIAGQKVGSDVVVAMTPEDGYGPNGNARAGIEGTDTLVFFIHIHEIVT